jgi:hypothetical protein
MCTHVYDQICLNSPRLVRASLLRSDPECLLEFEYRGEMPCRGAFIMGIEMVTGDHVDVRHCCIEFRDGTPMDAFTYDFGGHWQANHQGTRVKMTDNVVQVRFPSWPFQDKTPEKALSAFAIQNGATTHRGILVSESKFTGCEGSDAFYLQAG